MKKTYSISETAVLLTMDYLLEHAKLLRSQHFYLPASAKVVENLAKQIADEVALQIPMTPEQQVAALTTIMGCGPEDEAVGNKG